MDSDIPFGMHRPKRFYERETLRELANRTNRRDTSGDYRRNSHSRDWSVKFWLFTEVKR